MTRRGKTMKEWKIVIGSPGKIIAGNIRVESKMVDARTHPLLNRTTNSRSNDSRLNLTGFIKMTDTILSEHDNKEYRESRKYKELLFKKDDIFFVYDEDQPKSSLFQETNSNTVQNKDLIQKKSFQLELTTIKSGNSYYLINGTFTGFLKNFEENDFIQLQNVSIVEYLKREEGFLKLKYDKKTFVSINTKKIESVSEIVIPD